MGEREREDVQWASKKKGSGPVCRLLVERAHLDKPGALGLPYGSTNQ